MKLEELVKAVSRMKVQTGSLVCLGCGHEHSCSVHGCAILREAADLLDAYAGPLGEQSVLMLAGQALGTTPKRLRELAQADREGHLAVLPCKIGDKLWGIRNTNGKGKTVNRIVQEGTVTSMLFSPDMELIVVLQPIGHRKFGESAFYTREEAERALEEDHFREGTKMIGEEENDA